MHDKITMLHELCETISRELEDANEKIRKAGGALSAGDLDYIDKLTHTLKSIKTTIAMMEAEEDGGYSQYMPHHMSYDGNSYARGRSTRRDSMGRYSRRSYDDGMASLLEEMRGMMGTMPEEKRREVQRFIDRMNQM